MGQLRPDDYGYALEANTSLQKLLAGREAELVIGGHTHRRMVRRLGDVWFVNAGTLHRAFGAGFAVADLGGAAVQFYDLLDEEEIVPAERHELG